MQLTQTKIVQSLKTLARQYPEDMRQGQLQDVQRIAYNISLALDGADPTSVSVCDLGGGVGMFSVGLKAIGCHRSVLVDDFGDSINLTRGDSILALHQKLGVEIHSRDVVEQGLGADGPFDVVTTFDSMEHWHNSPKRLFHEVVAKLKHGGRFVLGVPNCINLRKRMTVPLGFGKWSGFEEWYEPERFRGHVREPDVEDLQAIAKDMGLVDVTILGRNWTGHLSPNRLTRIAAACGDFPLRAFPTLCGDIYLVGRTPSTRLNQQ